MRLKAKNNICTAIILLFYGIENYNLDKSYLCSEAVLQSIKSGSYIKHPWCCFHVNPLLSLKRRPKGKRRRVLQVNKNMVMGPDKA
jgi:hypothetical protein